MNNNDAGQGFAIAVLVSVVWWGVAVWMYQLFGLVGPFGWLVATIGVAWLAVGRN